MARLKGPHDGVKTTLGPKTAKHLSAPTPLTVIYCAAARTASAYAMVRASGGRPRLVALLPRSLGTAVRLGKCELCFELAAGGTAAVYLGIHHGAHGLEKLVAVKRLLPRFSTNPDYRAMLADEASVSSSVSHPCIREVFDLELAEDGTPYLVMEFLEGEPLSRVCVALRERADVLRTTRHHRVVAQILASCCHGIHAAHELSDRNAPLDVVHRDLTPQNLFALHDGTVRVMDFGIMRARVRRQPTSSDNVLKGKIAYMSPEYLERRPYDRRSDVWTLGVVLWELLTGARLFRRDSEEATFKAILSEPVPPPSTFAGTIDTRLDDVIAKAVTRNVDERYASAHEMAESLEGYLAASGRAVTTPDVGEWLREILPGSLPILTSIINTTRSRCLSP